jgi:hypothetical protein
MPTYTRLINGKLVTMSCPRGGSVSPYAEYEPMIRHLVAAGFRDHEVGERIGLTGEQVRRQRQRLNLDAAWPQGRPRKVRA